MGFQILEPEGLREKNGYLAGNDSHRVKILHELLDNSEVDCIWAARGGYGLHRIIDKIDVDKLTKGNKLIVGFSDICALHALIQNRTKLLSIHGPVITQLSTFEESQIQQVKHVIQNEWSTLTYNSTQQSIVTGSCEGTLVGGCLSVVAPLVGSEFMPPLENSILLLEDVGETVYRVDRLLQQLRLAGVFERISGIALGEFYGCEPRNTDEPDLMTMIKQVVGHLSIPVAAGLPFGHGAINEAIPLGAHATLEATDTACTLVVKRNG